MATNVTGPAPKHEVEANARALRKFWARRGHSVATRVVQIGTHHGGGNARIRAVWGIESDLVNGLPVTARKA